MASRSDAKRFSVHGWVGAALTLVSWVLNWSLSGPRTHLLFFPLWLGFCLFIDALVKARKGTSMITRSVSAYIFLFLISMPGWWLFELINWRTQNWHYDGRYLFTDFEYFCFASVCFSTVMPAVFGAAELVGTFRWIRRLKPGWAIMPRRSTLLAFFMTGCFMMGLLLAWPVYFFPFVWLSVYLILEPINYFLKNRSLFQYLKIGDWRPLVALWIGCLMCGLFWEMWNFYSYPKWVYDVPFVDFLHVFEMPLLGYGGYLPFSLELFCVYHLVAGLAFRGRRKDFIKIILP